VSLIASSSSLDAFPLDSLFEECNRFFDLDVNNDLMSNEAGVNFVTATVFPSREVCTFLSLFFWFPNMANPKLYTFLIRWSILSGSEE
jgi:hypothetical protein